MRTDTCMLHFPPNLPLAWVDFQYARATARQSQQSTSNLEQPFKLAAPRPSLPTHSHRAAFLSWLRSHFSLASGGAHRRDGLLRQTLQGVLKLPRTQDSCKPTLWNIKSGSVWLRVHRLAPQRAHRAGASCAMILRHDLPSDDPTIVTKH